MAHKPHHVEAQKLSKITIKEFGALFRKSVLIFLLIISNHFLIGQPVLLKDINPTGGSLPQNYFEFNNKIYFAANDGVNGNELWVTDGTTAGTQLVKDVTPGSTRSDPRDFFVLGNTLYFLAGIGPWNIWKTDGTANGTVQVTTNGSNLPADLSVKEKFNGALYFRSPINVNSQTGLNKFDGQTISVVFAPNSNVVASPSYLKVYNGKLYMLAGSSCCGEELRVSSDGLNFTTLKDIYPGAQSSFIGGGILNYGLVESGGLLYFLANDGATGTELWRTDGTTDGTILVKDINPGIGGSDPLRLTDVNGTLFFYAYLTNQVGKKAYLFKTTGTDISTVQMSSSVYVATGSGYKPINFGGKLFFLGVDDQTSGLYDLYKSDPSGSTIELIKEFPFFGNATKKDPYPCFTILNGLLYFFDEDGAAGLGALWKSDGTILGTTKVFDLNANSGFDPFSPFTINYGNSLIFTGGWELFKADFKSNQNISFSTLPSKTIGDAPFALTATATSGLPVTYTSSNTAVATVSGNTVTIVGVGTTNITASQAGDATYNPAPNVIQTLTVNSNGKQAQTITFNALPTKTIGEAPFALTGTASSGLPVSYTSSNPAVATVTGSAVTLVGVGTTIITASQGGDATYNPAISIPQTLVVQSPKLFNYSKYILASNPSTLTANVQSKNATTGEVSINGSDSQGPNTPFTFLWGDNTSSSAFFPATHTYVDKTKNYVASVIANYPNNQKDTVQVLINFVPYTINPVALDPKIKVIIPSTAFTFAGTRLYTPPANLTSFADNVFTSFTRSQTEYILSVASYIGYDFVNNDAFLYNGKFEQYMLSDPSFGGAYSIWYTNPVGFGVGNGFLGDEVDFSSLVHEMGHNYTLNMPANFYYGGRIDGNANAIFSEAMAQMFQHAVGYELINNYKLAGLGEDVQFKLKEKFINSVKLVKNSYTNYVNGGKVFKSWNDPGTPADETFNTFMTIAYKFIERAEQEGKGYRDPFKRMITTLQKFNATYAQLYDQQNNNSAADAFRSTLMVAAVSSAFQKDLRPDFIALNFPINNNIFDQLYGVPDIVVKQGTATISTNGTYDFGSVIIPSNSGDVIFSVQNPGTAVLVVDVSASTLTGANASDFSIDLSQSQSGIFKVRFTPSAGGVRNAQLSIVNNVVGKSPYIINFTGTGVSTKSNQTITFNTLPAKTFGEAPFTLEATASSLLPVSYTSSNTAVATLSGNIVTITGAGTTTITASQAGNETYNAATSVDQTLIVNKASQTILFNSLSAKYEGAGPFTLTATGGESGLPITFISSNPNVATISGDTVTIIAVGTTNITASQAGNANYEAAAEVSQPFTVNPKENQTITFEVSDKKLGDGSFQLTATASSNLAVAYATSSDKITINGNQVTLVKAGRTSIIASQAGNAEFNPAPSVERLFCIKPSKPLITASGFNTEAVTLTSSAAAGNQWYKDGLVIPGATNATLSAIAFGIYKVQVTADDCVSEFSADFPIIVTGDLPPKVSAVTISPNPVEDVLEIRGLEGGVNDFQLTDLTGRIASVELERNSSSFSISVKHLTQGMYILHAQTDSGLYQIKFIKK